MAKKFDLGSGHLGNGITVWNRAVEKHGDYEIIAHVDRDRTVTWRIKNPPKEVKDYVEAIATGKNPSVSVSQPDQKVFVSSIRKKIRTLESKLAIKLQPLDHAFMKHVKQKGETVDGIAAQLQIAAAQGNADYLDELQKEMGAKNLMELAHKILTHPAVDRPITGKLASDKRIDAIVDYLVNGLDNTPIPEAVLHLQSEFGLEHPVAQKLLNTWLRKHSLDLWMPLDDQREFVEHILNRE